METYLVRIFLYTALPLGTAWIVNRFDRGVKSRRQRLEIYLLYLFGLGVAGSGIGGFFGHLFLSDTVAESIGWAAGSPFQLEMGFANLALGVLGLMATARSDGFREATVIAVTVIGVGASIVHFMDIIQSGNLAPGNTLQNISNLAKPALLIVLLTMSRRQEHLEDLNESWRMRHGQAVGWMTAMAAGGFGAGFAFDQVIMGSAAGVLAGALLVYVTLRGGRVAALPV